MTGFTSELDQHLALGEKAQVVSSGAGTVVPELQAGGLMLLTATAVTITVGAPLFRGGVVSSDVVPVGTHFHIRINNTNGAGCVVTWNAVFKTPATPTIATVQFRFYDFVWDGTNWVQNGATPGDLPS